MGEALFSGPSAEYSESNKEGFYEDEVEESIVEAFAWLLDTPEFCDENGQTEQADDESRAIEIGNVHSYALDQGVPYERIELLFDKALE